jgi:Na+-translocating ferredoxin:NAD+ oxidoreductase RnfG subunit
MRRRSLLKTIVLAICGYSTSSEYASAKTYLTVEQSKKSLFKELALEPMTVVLSKQQVKSIQTACKVCIRNNNMAVWKTSDGDWFIVDQIIGKHEFIDMAVALTSTGKVKGVEILEYRESYGHEVTNPKWLAQFIGKGSGQPLKVDREILNISGATLSSVHVTEGINRLTETWSQVLRHI